MGNLYFVPETFSHFQHDPKLLSSSPPQPIPSRPKRTAPRNASNLEPWELFQNSLLPSLLPSLSSLLPYRPHQVLLNLPPKHFSTLFLLGPVSAFLLPKAFPDSQLVGLKGKFNVNLMKLKHLAPPLLRPWEGSGNVFKQSYIFANLLQKIF